MIKIVAPTMACNVIDRAIQLHGAAGVSEDTILARSYAYARKLRIVDGPDQVHMMQLGTHAPRGARQSDFTLNVTGITGARAVSVQLMETSRFLKLCQVRNVAEKATIDPN